MTLYLNGTTGISGVDGSSGTPAVQGTDTNTGISFPAADTIAVNTGGSERVRCDSSGRVGIGSTGPRASLEISDGSTNTAGEAVNELYVVGATTADSEGIVTIQSNDSLAANKGGSIAFGGRAVSASTAGANWAIINGFKENASSANYAGYLSFVTRASGGAFSEKARIDSSGRLLVGTSTSADSSALIQSYAASGSLINRVESASLGDSQLSAFRAYAQGGRVASVGVFKHSGITNTCGFLELRAENNSEAFYWTDNSGNLRVSSSASNVGTTGGTVVGTQTSDERLKNILGPVEYGLDTLKQIEPVRYALKSEPDTEKLGFIAQQVQPLVPQSVFDTNEHIEGEPEDAPTKLGMEYVALIPVLVNAIKELSAKNDALEARLAALETTQPTQEVTP